MLMLVRLAVQEICKVLLLQSMYHMHIVITNYPTTTKNLKSHTHVWQGCRGEIVHGFQSEVDKRKKKLKRKAQVIELTTNPP